MIYNAAYVNLQTLVRGLRLQPIKAFRKRKWSKGMSCGTSNNWGSAPCLVNTARRKPLNFNIILLCSDLNLRVASLMKILDSAVQEPLSRTPLSNILNICVDNTSIRMLLHSSTTISVNKMIVSIYLIHSTIYIYSITDSNRWWNQHGSHITVLLYSCCFTVF